MNAKVKVVLVQVERGEAVNLRLVHRTTETGYAWATHVDEGDTFEDELGDDKDLDDDREDAADYRWIGVVAPVVKCDRVSHSVLALDEIGDTHFVISLVLTFLIDSFL